MDLGEIFLQVPVLQEFYAVSSQLNNTSLFTLINHNRRHDYIKIIDLSYNNLTSICNNLFDNFYSLVELRLNNNNIYSIDHSFINSLDYIKTLNLAFNSIEYAPKLRSSSLEHLNLSSNNIRNLDDYFASHLRSIQTIDFDSNKYLNSISPRAFCFTNILTLKKISSRFTDIVLLNSFLELLCNLLENNKYDPVIDLNHNTNLKCNCMLIQFERYLINYLHLTCTQEDQDRYFISKVMNQFSNCTIDYCQLQKRGSLCDWNRAEEITLEGTCQGKLVEKENLTKIDIELMNNMTINTNLSDIIIPNSTIFYNLTLKSIGLSTKPLDYIYLFILLCLGHSIGFTVK